MDLTLQSKACVACAKAKRRCGKQIPTCGRCESRGIFCEYPSSKTFYLPPRQTTQSSPRPLTTTPTSDDAVTPSLTDMLLEIPGDSMAIDDLYPFHLDHLTNLLSPPDAAISQTKGISLPWYLEELSWKLDQTPSPEGSPIYSSTVLLDHVEVIKGWQSRWVQTGSSPYIHPTVYRFQLPRCVQDAYTTLSTYLEQKPTSKALVTRIVEDRVRQLLNDQVMDEQICDNETLDAFQHLARVHALHVYQAIGLYDGDIRLRHIAETQIPTLNHWLRQLMKSAEAEAAQGARSFILPLLVPPEVRRTPLSAAMTDTTSIIGPPVALGVPVSTSSSRMKNGYSNDSPFDIRHQLSQEESEWYAWSLAETIRRTWMVSTALQTVYLTLQVGHAPCPGGSMYTAREGLWDAKTAFAWAAQCREGNVDFVNRSQWSELFESRRPSEIDEFSKDVLEVTYGSERIEKWKRNTTGEGHRR